MSRIEIIIPKPRINRGPRFWCNPKNLWAARRRFFRKDRSNEWRYNYDHDLATRNKTGSFSTILGGRLKSEFRFLILGDTGEGDRSQYALLPLIRDLKPDFMIINGDVAYPAGDKRDFEAGFFEPYKNLNIPIWAVPGNHEYYSKNRGKEFYEVFCADKYKDQWTQYGLKFVKQPATFWELKEDNGTLPVVVLGIDSGMNGNLDGPPMDMIQLTWLTERLKTADENNQKVIILFHIPVLTDQKADLSVKLFALHYLIARYPCVRLVVAAHQHNYQQYAPEIFRHFLDKVAPATKNTAGSRAHYIITGGGGAGLTSTNFSDKDYPAENIFPSKEQWKTFAWRSRRLLDKMGTKNVLSRIVGLFERSVLSDSDTGQYLSFLMVDVKNDQVAVHPVLMNNLKDLYNHMPDGSKINILDPDQTIDTNTRNKYIKDPIRF